MPVFPELTESLDEHLDLPIRGKVYRVAAVDALQGLRCQAVVEIAAKAKAGQQVSEDDLARLNLDDDEERDFARAMLSGIDEHGDRVAGAVYEQLLADRVSWILVQRAARTVFTWTVMDEESALKEWRGENRPEAARPEPQDRKAPAKKKATKKRASSRSGSTRRPTSA